MKINEKIYPNRKKLLTTFFIADIAILIIVYLVFGGGLKYFNEGAKINELLIRDLIIILAWLLLSALLLFVLIKKNYYLITNNSLIHVRLGKEYIYDYNNILFIDDNYTVEHKTLLFYTNKGNSRFLILDKEELIYQALKKKCKNLLTKEEFHKKFPKIKL